MYLMDAGSHFTRTLDSVADGNSSGGLGVTHDSMKCFVLIV